ncbi:glycogen debranching enzyme GlgX, partial [Streptomyces sp. CHB19.2]|nr:glycogen debranching enzyme GlgX [Streptomyces sp. CHB19.2]
VPERDEHGERVLDDSFLVILHAGDEPADVRLPGPPWARRYEVVVDTGREDQESPPDTAHPADAAITVPGRTVLLLRAAG